MQAPSLFDRSEPAGDHRRDDRAGAAPVATTREASSLVDLLYDGFYMLFLLRSGHTPQDPQVFRERIRSYLAEFERGSKRLQPPAEDLHEAKFAFCALVDEVVLMAKPELREAWGRRPLQLEFFGEQLAGERFFEILERLRIAGAPKLQVLEIYHMCLLLGFQGRYILEGSEKLGYLTSRVGEEIAHLKGRSAGFAPHWAAPDRVSHILRRELPLWVMGSMFALAGLLAFAGLRLALGRQTEADLAGYAQVVRLAPQVAHVTISLP